MSFPALRSLGLILVAALALALRVVDLGRRPMHADEANQAVKVGELLEHGRYAFDPHDHHGPTLYYTALPVAWLRGQRTLAALDEITVRLVPALLGTLAVILLVALAAPAGADRATYLWALLAAALLAVAPAAVYYSRDFIQETLLGTFFLGTLVCARRWWRSGRLAWALGAGAVAGLMQATKATAPFFLAAAALGWLATRPNRPASNRWPRDLLAGAGVALLVAALFYSSFGTHLSGLRDAFVTYGAGVSRAADGAGHEKPWWYYVALLGFVRSGGVVFEQLAFYLLALAGLAVAFTREEKFLRWVAVTTIVIAVGLSLVPYKTPWHLVHFLPGMALLAAAAVMRLPRPWMRVGIAGIVIALQLEQTRLAVFERPADGRNPLAYVQSTPDVRKARPLADQALARSPAGIIRVIGEEYWPLPWYLRGLPRVGYWTTAPADCDAALIIATAAQAEAVRARLHHRYHEDFLGLRPGVLCVVFTPEP